METGNISSRPGTESNGEIPAPSHRTIFPGNARGRIAAVFFESREVYVKALAILVGKTFSKLAPVGGTAAGGAWSAIWTFPSVLASAMLIAWGAEAAQFLISQGLALAILAWLQTLPEFAVEAVIAHQAGQDPNHIHLMTANFTGSLRLLVGLGWPMIYVTAAYFYKRRSAKRLGGIDLDAEHAVEVFFLLIPILYFFVIWYKATLEWYDSVILLAIYVVYLVVLNKIPPKDEESVEDMERIPRAILAQKPAVRNAIILSLFLGGGTILYFVAHPFLESMLAIAVTAGISQFVFVQWVSPFLSEFPEKVSAFYWARKVSSAPMALMNMVSSNINQWTVLVAMLPMVYNWSKPGPIEAIPFDEHQQLEIILTIGQSLLGFVLLANMRFVWWEAFLLFGLWLLQFVFSGLEAPPPGSTQTVNQFAATVGDLVGATAQQVERFAHNVKVGTTWLYFALVAAQLVAVALKRRTLTAVTSFPKLLREHW
jgi:cation:H+ antiporter